MKISYLIFAVVTVLIAQELSLTVGGVLRKKFDIFLEKICKLAKDAQTAKTIYVSRMTVINR